MNVLQRMLARLTDAYNRHPDSNVGKLLNLGASEIETIRDALQDTRTQRDIDQATGETLDRIGINVQQLRGTRSDAEYRILLKTAIARNISSGNMEDIKEVIATVLDEAIEDIQIVELYDGTPEFDPEAAAILVKMPIHTVEEAGLGLDEFGDLVHEVVAGGVKAYIEWLRYWSDFWGWAGRFEVIDPEVITDGWGWLGQFEIVPPEVSADEWGWSSTVTWGKYRPNFIADDDQLIKNRATFQEVEGRRVYPI